MKTPILETERLLLRPFCENDAKEAFECWESDPDVARYMFWTAHNDLSKTEEWIAFEMGQIEKEDWYRFALIEKESKALIGTGIIYFDEEIKSWEIGYNLGKKYWGKGYTTEAMKRILEFGKQELGIKSVSGRCAKENPSSEHVMRKLGFQFVKDIPYQCNDGAVLREGKQFLLEF